MGVMRGEIEEIFLEDGKAKARVRVGSATMIVDLMLMISAKVRDCIVFDSGIALSRVGSEQAVVS